MRGTVYRCQHLEDATCETANSVGVGGVVHRLYLCDQCYVRLTNGDLTLLNQGLLVGLSVGRMIRVNMSALLEG